MLALIFVGGGAVIPVAPVADFTGSPQSGPAPLSVGFVDLSSGIPTSWLWTFGDGGTSTLQNPTHTYAVEGTYTVSLTATNAQGSDTKTRVGYISANAPVAARQTTGLLEESGAKGGYLVPPQMVGTDAMNVLYPRSNLWTTSGSTFEADEEARRIRQRKRRLMLVALASIGEDLL